MLSEFCCGRNAPPVVVGQAAPGSPAILNKGDSGDGGDGAGSKKTAARGSSIDWDAYDPGPGCRPCCSIPHGRNSPTAAIFCTVAFALSFATVVTCDYLTASFTSCMKPPPPQPEFGMCGDCHCIPDPDDGSGTCPSDEERPNMTFDPGLVDRYEASEALNPYDLGCDPYQNATCSTTPPQDPDELALGDVAACGVRYEEFLDFPSAAETSSSDNGTSPPSPQCPTVARYNLETYPSVAAAEADGAFVTHRGACGVCSTLRDLAAYIEHTDLVDKGTECSFRGLRQFEDGVRCYMEVGFTEPCSKMWVYNGFQTRDFCAGVCGIFTITGAPNNGPPPACELSQCLECDEKFAGPEFASVAARTRRRSGLLSKIARPCSALLLVDHIDPCDVYQLENPSQKPQSAGSHIEVVGDGFYRIVPGQCYNYTDDLGLFWYSGARQGGGIASRIIPFSGVFDSEEDRYFKSTYGKCYKYSFKSASEGFWYEIQTIFGPTFTAASTFAVLGVTLGFASMAALWTSICVAFKRATWISLAICNIVSAIFVFLTLLFFASDVCMHGCQVGSGAIYSIISGTCFIVAAAFCLVAAPYNKRQRALQCCCCPVGNDEYSGGITDITVRRTIFPDGSIVTERVTSHPSGFKSVERTTCLADQEWEEEGKLQSPESTADAASVEKEPLLPAQPTHGDEIPASGKNNLEKAFSDE